MWTSSKNKLYFAYFLWIIDKSSFSSFALSCEAFSDIISFFIFDRLTFESFRLISMSICYYDLSLLTSSKRVYFYWICSYFWWTSNILISFSFKMFINSEFSFKSELKFYFSSLACSSSNSCSWGVNFSNWLNSWIWANDRWCRNLSIFGHFTFC